MALSILSPLSRPASPGQTRPALPMIPSMIPSVSFSGELLRGIDREDMALIRKLVASCRYQKRVAQMVEPENVLDVRFHDDNKTVTIDHNNQYFESGQELQGVCHELTVLLGRKLQIRMGKNYEIKGVSGNCPGYFRDPATSNHCYLLAWPKYKTGAIERAIAENPGKIPRDCLIIDPSFHKVGYPEELPGYTFKSLNPLSHYYTRDTFTHVFPQPNYGSTSMPMGYLKDFLKKLPEGFNARSLLYLTISNWSFPKASLSIQQDETSELNGDYRVMNPIQELLGDEHPVVRLMMAIRRGFWNGRE